MSLQYYNSVTGTNKLAIRTVFNNPNCNAFNSSSTLTICDFFVLVRCAILTQSGDHLLIP